MLFGVFVSCLPMPTRSWLKGRVGEACVSHAICLYIGHVGSNGHIFTYYMYILPRGRYRRELLLPGAPERWITGVPPRGIEGWQNIYKQKSPVWRHDPAGVPGRMLAGGMAWAPAEGRVCL